MNKPLICVKTSQHVASCTHTYAHPHAHTWTSLGKYGQIKVGTHLLNSCNFIKEELGPDTGRGVPTKRERGRE